MTLSLSVQFASTLKTLPVRAQVRRWALAAHALAQTVLKLESMESEITIRYVDEQEGRDLNKSFRGKDYATNVLTFVSNPSPWEGGSGRRSAHREPKSKSRYPHPFRAMHETPSASYRSSLPLVETAAALRPAPSAGPPGRRINPQVRADIAICAPVVAREAKAQKKTAHAHHAHMVVHGVLHAMGFDHENDRDAETMESIEIAVLSRFRINNPYEEN